MSFDSGNKVLHVQTGQKGRDCELKQSLYKKSRYGSLTVSVSNKTKYLQVVKKYKIDNFGGLSPVSYGIDRLAVPVLPYIFKVEFLFLTTSQPAPDWRLPSLSVGLIACDHV